jgi:hypothetical protein
MFRILFATDGSEHAAVAEAPPPQKRSGAHCPALHPQVLLAGGFPWLLPPRDGFRLMFDAQHHLPFHDEMRRLEDDVAADPIEQARQAPPQLHRLRMSRRVVLASTSSR